MSHVKIPVEPGSSVFTQESAELVVVAHYSIGGCAGIPLVSLNYSRTYV